MNGIAILQVAAWISLLFLGWLFTQIPLGQLGYLLVAIAGVILGVSLFMWTFES